MTLRIKIFADSSVRISNVRDGTYDDFINSKCEQLEKGGWVVREIEVEGTYHSDPDHPKYEMFTVIHYSRPLSYRLKLRIKQFFVGISDRFRNF